MTLAKQDELKRAVAQASLVHVEPGSIVGVGTGSTVNCFIDCLATIKHDIEGCVASSAATRERLKAAKIPVYDLNSVDKVPVYIDGADEANAHGQLIKGGGGALTQEKIVAAVAEKFICIIDESKYVPLLGKFPLPIEVIPCARSYVGRQLVKLGGDPVYRDGFVTDNGNIILDVYHLDLTDPLKMEAELNNIVGVVCNGLFARRAANVVLMSKANGEIVTQSCG